ncbi:interferon-related developmental regulator-domain-containing protein [Lasiosphaeria ovina]|uniref:Interferon-related developmental regulator-domain-containing protein n=1 Tax=Lasiosphaeria ovina TaxID=92902 RepID=A0AAE0MZX9_9PEZI|nr:interferon-related developmental regulator-domain-containing protein [Lasiosphaeria ovina]
MHDLRKKALLESGKTLSRKARLKPDGSRLKSDTPRSSANQSPNQSPGNSRAGSRANSRPGSRYASEDEGGVSDADNDDDIMTMSTNSASADDDEFDEFSSSTWSERLRDHIAELKDRKRSIQAREETLAAYLHILRHHFALSEIRNSVSEVVPALLRSIRGGGSEEERTLATAALTMTILTFPSETVFEHVLPTLKAACEEDEEATVKVEAIQALSIAVAYGGGSSTAADDILDYLLEIIESDGRSAGADDNGAVVSAALQAWAFVASHVEDLEAHSDQAIEAFMEQLDSTDPDVQTGAGCNIALLFEAAREYEQETGESFNLQYNQHRIVTRMAEIVKDSSKTISKKGRKQLRSKFSSIVTSLERGKGPGYSTAGRGAVNPHTGGNKTSGQAEFQEFGYREKLRVNDQIVVINTWSLHARVDTLKAVLGGGIGKHYTENPVIKDILNSAEVELLWKPKKSKYSIAEEDED